jgi:SDR family mycofactocin-dependent oxidoreductase
VGRVSGKVAFITGAARGQGRSHAVRLAQEGADVIAFDACTDFETVTYPMASAQDLQTTVKEIEALGRRVVAEQVDVRDLAGMSSALEAAVGSLGRLDIVVANAGIVSYGTAHTLGEDAWQQMIDINMTGVWKTCRAAIPHLLTGGAGGSIVLTSSVAGVKGVPHAIHYTAAKHGVVGIMRTLANELAADMIRVNTVHPTAVSTDMIHNEATYRAFRPDLDAPGRDDAEAGFTALNALPVPWIEPVDVSNAVLFLASDEARYITGSTLLIDAGQVAKA